MFFEHCQDAIDREGEDGQKIWVTKSTNRTNLFEFVNKTMYRDDKPTRIYSLPKPFTVSAIFNFWVDFLQLFFTYFQIGKMHLKIDFSN